MKPSFVTLGALVAFAGAFPATSHAQTPTFTTDVTNIAASQNGGRVLSVTSTLDNSKEYSASNLIDGQAYNAANGTGSKGWASNQYDPINMDLITLGFAGNQLHKIGKIVLNPSCDLTPERWAKDVEIQVSTDTAEGPYTPVAQLTLKRSPEPQSFAILPVDARFVRLAMRTNWGSDRAVGLGEVEIYEAIDGSDAMGQVINRLDNTIADLRRYQQTQQEGGAPTTTAADAATTQPAARRTTKTHGAKVQNIQLVTDEAERTPVAKVNIAAAKNGGRIAAFSSTFDNDPQYGPDKLIDGQNFRVADGKGTYGWASQGFLPGKEFVTIGFKDDRTHLVGKFTINPVSNQSDLRWARRIDVQVSSDSAKDGPWKTAATLKIRDEAVNQDFVIRPVEAKYVRFVFEANGPGVVLPNADPNVNSDRAVSLGEIEIYEAVAGNDQLESLIGRFNQVLVDLKTLHRNQINTGTAPDALTAPAHLRTPAVGKAGATPAKVGAKPAKKNVEEAGLKARSTRLDG